MTGRIEGLALVVGTAASAFEDAAPYKDRASLIIAVNAMITGFPGDIQIGVTLHPEFAHWYYESRRYRQTTPWLLYSSASNQGVTHVVQQRWPGTSSLYAVQIAQQVGARRVVLAGSPMDLSPKFDEQPNGLGAWLDQYREAWTKAKDEFVIPVRSASGWTRELLGAPPEDWLK